MPSVTMETRARSSDLRSSTSMPLFYTYLKPGALARLRYKKISARCREIDAQTLVALCQLKSSLDSAVSQPHSAELPMNGVPCFDLRVAKYPRCYQRKRLIAVTPIFSETQS